MSKITKSMYVRVPATSANLGPGFDCLGIALDLYNTFHFTWTLEQGMETVYTWDAVWDLEEDNLIRTSYEYFERTVLGHKELPPFTLAIDADVPQARGLGSSATCIAAGLYAAQWISEVVYGTEPLTETALLRLATDIEGHPDNVAPALFGGLQLSAEDGGLQLSAEDGGLQRSAEDEATIHSVRLPVADSVYFVALIPDFALSTKDSRGVLPQEVPFADAVSNAKRIGFLLEGLKKGDLDLIRFGTRDALHQPYRKRLIPGFDEVEGALERLGLCAVLSGAGPTVLGIGVERDAETNREVLEQIAVSIPKNWSLHALSLVENGAIVGF